MLSKQIRDTGEANAAVVTDVIRAACRRFPSLGHGDKTTRVEQMIHASAWTDVALALLDFELPLWRIRRLAYDDGEWYCALSRQRELPEWLDDAIETRHADLSLAILSAFVEAQRVSRDESRPSVPLVARSVPILHEPTCVENFS